MCLPGELQLIRKLKVYETTQAPSQFIKTTKLPAVPFTCIGKICNIKTCIRIFLRRVARKGENHSFVFCQMIYIPQTL